MKCNNRPTLIVINTIAKKSDDRAKKATTTPITGTDDIEVNIGLILFRIKSKLFVFIPLSLNIEAIITPKTGTATARTFSIIIANDRP